MAPMLGIIGPRARCGGPTLINAYRNTLFNTRTCHRFASSVRPSLLSTKKISHSMRPSATVDPTTTSDDDLDTMDNHKVVLFSEMSYEQKYELFTRLCENDVEFMEMKHMCKDNDLGGKDMKYNLRAKLIRKLRELLGKPVWDKTSYGRRVKRPDAMSDSELAKFFREREVVMPEDQDEAIGLAFAMLVTDGIFKQEEVPTTSAYDRFNAKELAKLCLERGLPHKGNKGELLSRLQLHDELMEKEILAARASAAAKKEKAAASIHIPPRPPNRSMALDLREAQVLISSITDMTLPELRAALLARKLPVYGTHEVLEQRLINVLRRDVIEAHAGLGRMVRYAQAAVGKLASDEVFEALAARGMATYSLAEDSRARLANALVDGWIQAAMQPDLDPTFDLNDEDEEGPSDGTVGRPITLMTPSSPTGSSSLLPPLYYNFEDPTLDIVLVCGGSTPRQRNQALTAARMAVPLLQSDALWGTLAAETTNVVLDTATEQDDASSITAPSELVSIAQLFPLPNGVEVWLDSPLPPRGCTAMVTAAPLDGQGPVIVAEGTKERVMVDGLIPAKQYGFTARYKNSAGKGPESESFCSETPFRYGIAVKVLYPVVLDRQEPSNASASQSSDDKCLYVPLTWTEIHSSSAEELDARLHAALSLDNTKGSTMDEWSSKKKAMPLDEAVSSSHVVLPLGFQPMPTNVTSNVSHGSSDSSVVTSWRVHDVRDMVASRSAFTSKVLSLGYAAASLLNLDVSSLRRVDNNDDDDVQSPERKEVEKGIIEWMSSQNLDINLTRVAVRVESCGDVIQTAIAKGLDQIIEGAATLGMMHNVHSVVVEAIHPASVYFTCTVMEGEQGPVALPPTETSYQDLEESIIASELMLQRFYEVEAGEESSKVDALCALTLEDNKMHPAFFGGSAATATQQIMHSTPPASLSTDTSMKIRTASLKLFKDLGLRDFAQFSGWIIPEDSIAAAGLSDAFRIAKEEIAKGNNSNMVMSNRDGENDSIHNQATSNQKGKSFSQLLAIDAAEREQREKPPSAVTLQEKADAVDVESSAAATTVELEHANHQFEEEGTSAVQYGTFAGIELNDKTRMDIMDSMVMEPCEPIPDGLPDIDIPIALPDVSAILPAEACITEEGVITFHQLSIVPDFSNRLGILSQQAASAGISWLSLPRQLASLAAARQDLPTLPLHFDNVEEITENWPPVTDPSIDEEERKKANEDMVSMEEIGTAIAGWDLAIKSFSQAEGNDSTMVGSGGEGLEGEDLQSSFVSVQGVDDQEDTEDRLADAAADAAGMIRSLGMFDESNDGLDSEDDADESFGGTMQRSSRKLNNADDRDLDEYMDDTTRAAAVLAQQFPGLHPTRQRVWIVCGGEGPERDASIQAAVHAMTCLQGEKDLLMETFFLEPPDAGQRELARREELLLHRLNLSKIGADDDIILIECPEFHPTRIRHPELPAPHELATRGIWRLAGSSVVKTTVEDMQRGCEEALSYVSIPSMLRKTGDDIHGIDQLLTTATCEVDLAGIAIGGPAIWGGAIEYPQSPEYSFMEDWVDFAASQCVVVLLAIPSHPSGQGHLQQLLEKRGVPFTGPPAVAVELCADRSELLRALSPESNYDSSLNTFFPSHSMALPELMATCDTEQGAEEFFGQLFGSWTEKMMVIRPAKTAGTMGVARISSGNDLRTYLAAVNSWEDHLPEGALPLEEEEVRMVVPPPTQFVLEPYLPATPLLLRNNAGNAGAVGASRSSVVDMDGGFGVSTKDALHDRLEWPSTDKWLEIRACLLGSAGGMNCQGITTSVVIVDTDAYGNEIPDGMFDLTPPPPSILHPSIIADVEIRMQLVADRLGLSGAAQISALVNAEKGDIVIVDVDPHPDLGENSLLMRQAAQASPTLTPREVLRMLLKIGMTKGEDVEEDGEDMSGFFSADEYGMSDGDGAVYAGSEVPDPQMSYFGNPYIKLDDDYLGVNIMDDEDDDEYGDGDDDEYGDEA